MKNDPLSEKKPPDNALVDIRTVSVRKELPREERVAEFVRQIGNPYKFKCGRVCAYGRNAGGTPVRFDLVGSRRQPCSPLSVSYNKNRKRN